MRTVIGIAISLLLAWPAASAELPAIGHSAYDGDSPRVILDGKTVTVRLINVDSPEIRGACESEKALALRARDFTRNFIQQPLILTTTKREKDKYGRLLAFVRNSDGKDLGEALIENGLAVRWEGKRHQGWCN